MTKIEQVLLLLQVQQYTPMGLHQLLNLVIRDRYEGLIATLNVSQFFASDTASDLVNWFKAAQLTEYGIMSGIV